MPNRPGYPLETIEAARKLPWDGVRVREIAAATGLTVGALYYYHLDGHSLPGLAPAAPARRFLLDAHALARTPKARTLPCVVFWRKEDLAALRELTRIPRDLFVLGMLCARPAGEHEQALSCGTGRPREGKRCGNQLP